MLVHGKEMGNVEVPFGLVQGSRCSRDRPDIEQDEYGLTRGIRKPYMVHRTMLAFCRRCISYEFHLEHYKHTITALLIRKFPVQTLAIALFACMIRESIPKALNGESTYRNNMQKGLHPKTELANTTPRPGSAAAFRRGTTYILTGVRKRLWLYCNSAP